MAVSLNSNCFSHPRSVRLGSRRLRKSEGKQKDCWRDCCASTSEEFTSPAAKRGPAMSDKIKPHHLERKAILYIRQSAAYQVSHKASRSNTKRLESLSRFPLRQPSEGQYRERGAQKVLSPLLQTCHCNPCTSGQSTLYLRWGRHRIPRAWEDVILRSLDQAFAAVGTRKRW